MEHQCVIGIWNDYDYSPLITMNNFFFAYIIIGFLFYTIILSLIYHIGIDNIKNVTDDEDIKNLNFESFSTNIILLILCIFMWPTILLYVLLSNNN